VVHLNELWNKYKAKGVIVVAVTNEPRGLVDAFVEKNKPEYPIVIESSDSARLFDIKGFPTQYAIGPDGKISGGTFDEGLIQSLLPKVRIPPKLPEKLAAARQKLLDKEKYADARKLLADAAAKGADEEKKAAEEFLKWLDDGAAASLVAAAESETAGDYGGASETYQELMTEFVGLEPATKAADAMKALLADPAKKKEVDAAKALSKAKDEAAEENSAKKKIALFEAVAKKWKDTKAGLKAAEMADQLARKK
jgi:hypothetical protein